jgi:hypothetical protein
MVQGGLHRLDAGQRGQVFLADLVMEGQLLAPVPPLIVRVKFRNGTVRELMGDDGKCQALFDHDMERLIDYVQTLDPSSLEFSIWYHKDDVRWEGVQL